MSKRFPLRPETVNAIIESQQAPVPPSFFPKLTAACMAYQSAENNIAWYSLVQPNAHAEQVARAAAARLRVPMQEMLAQLVISH